MIYCALMHSLCPTYIWIFFSPKVWISIFTCVHAVILWLELHGRGLLLEALCISSSDMTGSAGLELADKMPSSPPSLSQSCVWVAGEMYETKMHCQSHKKKGSCTHLKLRLSVSLKTVSSFMLKHVLLLYNHYWSVCNTCLCLFLFIYFLVKVIIWHVI